MDLESLSDAELEQLASGKTLKPPSLNLNDLSDDELSQLAGEKPLEEPGILSKIGTGALDAAVAAGQFVDSYTGAPTRSAIGALQDGKSPLSAFAAQFGDDPTKAPTGKDIVAKAGVSTDDTIGFGDYKVSPAGIAGFALDVAADPTNLLPVAAGAKLLGRGTVATLKGANKYVASPLLSATGRMAGKAAIKTGQALEPTLSQSRLGAIAVDSARTAKRVMDSFFHPKQVPNFQEYVALAERNGIDPSLLPESIEFGPGSSASRLARANRENVLTGEPEMELFRNGLMQVDSAIENKIAQLGGGPPLNEVEAGKLISQGYDNAVNDLFNNVDFTYNSVIDQAPGITLTPKSVENINKKLADIQDFANEALHEGITKTDRTQADQLLKAVTAVRRRMSAIDPQAGTFGSLKQVYGAMSKIGRYAFQKQQALSDVPIDKAKFQDLYFTLREEFINSTAHRLGDDVASSLVDSNQQIKMFLDNKKPIADLLDSDKIAPEKLFRSLIVNGDTRRLGALKDMLAPEQFNRLRASYVEGLVTRNSDDTINFGALRSKLARNTSTLSVLFSPDEIKDFVDLATLGEKWGPAVLSTSGTAPANLLRDTMEGVKAGITSKATLDLLKRQARGGGQPLLEATQGTAQAARPSLLSASKGFQRPIRTKPEETAKLLQILSTLDNAGEKEEQSAMQRRMEEIVRKRLSN